MLKRIGLGVLILIAVSVFVAMKTPLLLVDILEEPLGSSADADVVFSSVSLNHGSAADLARRGVVHLQTKGTVGFLPARLGFGLSEPDVTVDLTVQTSSDSVTSYVIHNADDVLRGTHTWRPDPTATGLLVESVEHLFLFPLTAPAMPTRHRLPDKVWETEPHQRVFSTWGGTRATMESDQVIVWVRNGRLVRFDTTGRSIAPFIHARVEYEGEVAVGAIRLPKHARIYNQSDGALVHEWTLISAK